MGTIKWVKFGDEGTKFFHANAIIRHMRNLITSLEDDNGQAQSDHNVKANIFWESFKERLVFSDSPVMHFNLEDLLSRAEHLGCLSEPFSNKEIDVVVNNLPNDKTPGSDGFNTNFVKHYLPLIKKDFYDLCAEFHARNICLQSLNGSHITLIPKKDGPTKVSDYRPISLLNTSVKIITKLLANRLQRVIMDLIHRN
jgi:hypothetical protein